MMLILLLLSEAELGSELAAVCQVKRSAGYVNIVNEQVNSINCFFMGLIHRRQMDGWVQTVFIGFTFYYSVTRTVCCEDVLF